MVLFYTEDRDSRFLRNAGSSTPNKMASPSRTHNRGAHSREMLKFLVQKFSFNLKQKNAFPPPR
jgi:hypothetical protein